MNVKMLIDRIFKQPGVKFELTEFENLGEPIHEIIEIYPKAAASRWQGPGSEVDAFTWQPCQGQQPVQDHDRQQSQVGNLAELAQPRVRCVRADSPIRGSE